MEAAPAAVRRAVEHGAPPAFRTQRHRDSTDKGTGMAVARFDGALAWQRVRLSDRPSGEVGSRGSGCAGMPSSHPMPALATAVAHQRSGEKHGDKICHHRFLDWAPTPRNVLVTIFSRSRPTDPAASSALDTHAPTLMPSRPVTFVFRNAGRPFVGHRTGPAAHPGNPVDRRHVLLACKVTSTRAAATGALRQ